MKSLLQLPMFWRNLPLATKFASFASLLVVLVVTALTLVTIQRESVKFEAELDEQARAVLPILSSGVSDHLYNRDITEIGEIARNIQTSSSLTRFKVYGMQGNGDEEIWELWVDSRQPNKIFPPDPEPPTSSMLSTAPDEIYPPYWEADERVALQVVGIGNRRVGAVQIGFSKAPLQEKISSLIQDSVILSGAAIIVSVLLASWMARQLSSPISELTRTAKKMAGGDLITRFSGQSQDEIGQLGRAFNNMASAIEKRETDLVNLANALEQKVQERTLELQQQNRYLGALNEITLGMTGNLEVEALLKTIVTRAAELANTEHAFVNVVDHERGEMQRRVATGNYRRDLGEWIRSNHGLSGQVMATGQMRIEEDYQKFEGRDPAYDWLRTSIYMPLLSESIVLGVIGLGYDKVVPVQPDYVSILNQFAQLASLALRGAQEYSDAIQEIAKRRQEEELRKISPQGQAETLAVTIVHTQERAWFELHELAQRAEEDATIAIILPELKGALERLEHPVLARLAEGYQEILRSKSERELLAVGLRDLIGGLGMPEAKSLQYADDAAALYLLCQQAIEAQSIHAITELMPALQTAQADSEAYPILGELAGVFYEFIAVGQSLHAYERVETTEDRMSCLGSAAERLSHADRVVHALRAADRPIARRIVENWRAIVTTSMTDLQTRARLSFRLVTRQMWDGDVVTVALRLRNDGRGMAHNLRLSPVEGANYDFVDENAVIERLATGEEAQVELRVRPRPSPQPEPLRVRFVVLYDDPRGPDQVEHFADVVQREAPPAAFEFIPNPYVAGTPLEAGSPLFFGREDLFSFIAENLNAAHHNNLVLIGQRRTGKSSLLKQLPLRLSDDYLPVYLDGQSIALDPGLPAFFMNLATEIGFALEARGFSLADPKLETFAERPAYVFEHDYLRRVRRVIGNRHLVLLLDEFEELESAARRGNLDASIFGFLRHLIQHGPGLSVIFCGTHRIEELTADYFGVLFNISLYKHVGFLEQDEATRLIQEPVAPYGMRYDDLALDKAWRITAGHPYFLQLLCHSVVNQHNRVGRSYVTITDVNAALDEILSSGEAHFVYLWNESSPAERQVLTALSRMMPLTGRATPVQVEDYLAERGIPSDRHAIADTLHHLTLRDILAMQVDSQPMGIAGTYTWRLGLLGLWIEKYKSLSLVQEETHR